MCYVALALSPSHYQIGLSKLGVDVQPLWGVARPIRSDDWMVFTPLTQLAVRGGFSSHDQVSPYGQSLKSFMPLPIADWSLMFKPQLWCYWVLPPAYAYSAYWAIMWCSMLIGYALLLRECRVPVALAILGSGTLWMTHYVQVWWVGPAPAFALAPWPAVILASSMKPWLKWILLPYITAVWMLGFVYPPYQIPTTLALGALLVGLRRDILALKSLALIAATAMVVLAIGYGYLHDVIEVMRNTVYPGARVSEGGGVAVVQLVAHLLPYVSTWEFSPLISASNECEVAVVASLLPLLLLVCLDYRELRNAIRGAGWPIWIIGGVLTLMLAWIALPIPSGVGRLLLWHYVPPKRMTWAFGMLLTLSTTVVLSRARVRFDPWRVALVCALMLVSWLSGQRMAADSAQKVPIGSFDWFEFAGSAAIVGVWISLRLVRQRFALDDRIALGCASLAAGLVTFGTFNPIQSARVIFDIPPSARQREFREQAGANPNGWLIAPGIYGAILNGAGVPAINHCLPTPQLEFFRAVFPDMDSDRFNEVFNRYANVIALDEPAPRLHETDAVIVPVDAFNAPQPAAVAIGNRIRSGESKP